MKKVSPAQERILEQLGDKLVSYVGKSTDLDANTLHGPAVEALVRSGLVEVSPSKEQPTRRLARLTNAGSARQARQQERAEEQTPPTQPSVREVPPAPPKPGGKGRRSAVRRRKAKEELKAREDATKVRKEAKPRSVFDPEPEVIKKARDRIKRLVAAATEGHPPQAVHLVLAIVNQETGNHSAANALIKEYRLDDVFGLKRFT